MPAGRIRRARTAEDQRERREQILRAAERLMATDGFHATSMQALADEAGVSVGLIYRYFSDKDSLLLAVLSSVIAEFGAALPAALGGEDDPVRALAAGFRAYCLVIDRHRDACRLAYRESATLDRRGRHELKCLEVAAARPLAAAVERGRSAGYLAADCPPELVAHNLIVLAQAWALKFWHLPDAPPVERYIERQLALLLGGLVTPPRRDAYRDLLAGGAA